MSAAPSNAPASISAASGLLSAAACAERASGPAPALRRRLAAFMYEGVLLFGVLFVMAIIYGVTTNQRHGLHGRTGLMAMAFLTLGVYFIWLWTHGGQTLAMRTWRIQVVGQDGSPISPRQALSRYLAAWLWLAPPLAGLWLAGWNWHYPKTFYGAMGSWIVIYTSLTWLLPQGQFLHDIICRTRLIDTRPSETLGQRF
jgi:uncharacterized RDD family membrane protein YckC